MADKKIKVEIVGDASSLEHALDSSSKAADKHAKSHTKAAKEMDAAGRATTILEGHLGDLAHKGNDLTTAIGGATSSIAGLGVAAGAGLLVEAAKSAVEIAERREKAEKSLDQALAGSSISQGQLKRSVEEFIDTNKRYVKDQPEVIENYAKLTRQGLDYNKIQRDMNIALDLSATKGISLSEATDLVSKAEDGRFKGLIGLGIETKHLTNALGEQVTGAEAVNLIMEELAGKEKDGRKTTTELEQAQNELNNRWQTTSKDIGPPLIDLFAHIVSGADEAYKHLQDFGRDDKWWKGLNDGLINVALAAQNAFNWVNNLSSLGTVNIPSFNAQSRTAAYDSAAHRAGGGSVASGGTYIVGEDGPETLVMGGQGGTVIPNGQGGSTYNVTFNINGASDPAAVARAVDRRLSQLSAL